MQPQIIARYSVNYGLSGCYMPDSHMGPYVCYSRAELAQIIRDCLAQYEMPKRLFYEVKLRSRLWPFIKQHGSSQAHFTLTHGGHSLSFIGLTEEEFEQAEKENG